MKKFIVPALALSFFVATTPVYAAPFNFGDFFNFLRTRLFAPVSTPSTGFGSMVKETVAPNITGTQQFRFGETEKEGNLGTPPAIPTQAANRNQNSNENGITNRNQNANTNQNENRNQNQVNSQGQNSNATPGSETRAEKLQALVTRMFDNLQNRIDNYTDFLTKVETRRDKLFNDGKDVTNLDAFIQTAKTNLAAAQAALNNADNALANLDYTQNPGTIIKQVREQLKIVREAMTTLHKSMSETVREILNLTAQTTSSVIEPTTKSTGKKLEPKPPVQEPATGKSNNPGRGNNK